MQSAEPPPRQPRQWRFDEARPEWRSMTLPSRPDLGSIELTKLNDATRLQLRASPEQRFPMVVGGLVASLDGLRFADWDAVQVRARCHDRLAGITVAYNVDDEKAMPDFMVFFASGGDAPPVFNDGSTQTYVIPLHRHEGDTGEGLRSLALLVAAPREAGLELQAITLVPRGAGFDHSAGTRSVVRAGTTRHALYAHAPATLDFPLRLDGPGRLDLALAVNPGETVTYRIAAEVDGQRKPLLAETVSDAAAWRQYAVDLSSLAGNDARLVFEASSEQPGAVALWGGPVVSATPPPRSKASTGVRAAADRSADRTQAPPNVILYVIDGGGADLMSLYGYERPTTPFLQQLAREGVVFEHAYSNATWTQASTVSFMTSLQHSVLGGLRRGVHSTAVPTAAVTMAERFRRGGYQTAVLTTNPNCARLVGLERGVDWLRDDETEHHSTSSRELHQRFWELRKTHPATPYWAHFQTTDVHEPNEPEAPFAGRFLPEAERAKLGPWEGQLWQAAASLFGTTSIVGFMDEALARGKVPRHEYFEARRALYDETMAFQDSTLAAFVAELKKRGEWENTLLVVTADHGHPAGTFTRFGRGLIEPQPEPWQGGLFESYLTRVPLLFVWPGHLQAGTRVREPVSLVDLMPTLLDLAGLPAAEVAQGRSLAPALRGEQLAARPVILDEFRVDEATSALVGNLDVVDGRWGASLEIGPPPAATATTTHASAPQPAATQAAAPPDRGRHAVPAGGRWGAVHPYFADVPRLLLYDLERDPQATHAVNDEHPDLVDKYRRLLYHQWQAQRALAKKFGDAAEAAALTPEQLEQLKSLGYIQ